MNELSITVGVIGSLASIIALFIAAPGWQSKVTHVAYALVITAISTIAFEYRSDSRDIESRLQRFENIEKQAGILLKSKSTINTGSSQGFMLGGLTFLEKNKDLFPDTYERAKLLFKSHACTATGYHDGKSDAMHFNAMNAGANTMYTLIQGIVPNQIE